MKIEEKEAEKKYNIIAEHYHNWRTKINPKGYIFNEHLEMPGMLKLLGNVKEKKILDFGCGTGIYSKILKNKGADVKGFDISPGMLKIAKRYVNNVEFRLGKGNNIPFNEKFDIVFASLVLEHINNWDEVFKEVKKVLKKDGYFIFSIGNPIIDVAKTYKIKSKPIYKNELPLMIFEDYFTERKIYKIWKSILHKKEFKDIKMPAYHKTYETIIKTILKNNFEIIDYKDCYPIKKAKKLFPKQYRFLSKVPYFCVWKVRKK